MSGQLLIVHEKGLQDELNEHIRPQSRDCFRNGATPDKWDKVAPAPAPLPVFLRPPPCPLINCRLRLHVTAAPDRPPLRAAQVTTGYDKPAIKKLGQLLGAEISLDDEGSAALADSTLCPARGRRPIGPPGPSEGSERAAPTRPLERAPL